jgi:2-desacetyl-2-hydroxyethyl bacteriochlorophyllide A dehydrogenase
MKAAVLVGREKIEVKDIPVPKATGSDVLIEVKTCGICGTDIHAYFGGWRPAFPLVLGHEFAGVVKETGENVRYIKKGDRVTANPDIYCYYCENCRSGNEKLCQNWESIGSTKDGAFAQYCLCPEQTVYKIPDSVSFRDASFTEPIACAFTAIKNIREIYAKRILITGAGSIGLIFVMLLRLMSPLALDITSRSADKCKTAKKLGADNAIDISGFQGDYSTYMDSRYDVIIDATGMTSVVEDSYNLLDQNGELYIFGVAAAENQLKINHFSLLDKNTKIIGIYPDMRSFSTILKMMEKKTIDPSPIISHEFALDDFMQGFDLIKRQSGPARKVLISI